MHGLITERHASVVHPRQRQQKLPGRNVTVTSGEPVRVRGEGWRWVGNSKFCGRRATLCIGRGARASAGKVIPVRISHLEERYGHGGVAEPLGGRAGHIAVATDRARVAPSSAPRLRVHPPARLRSNRACEHGREEMKWAHQLLLATRNTAPAKSEREGQGRGHGVPGAARDPVMLGCNRLLGVRDAPNPQVVGKSHERDL